MQERIRAAFMGLVDRWKAFSRRQKTQIIAIAAALLVSIVFVLWIMLRPSYVVIYPGTGSTASISDIANVEAALIAAQIPTKKANNGTQLLVNENDAGAAMLHLEKGGVINDPGFTYPDAFDASGIGVTESTKAEMRRLAHQTYLEGIIKGFGGVIAAKVSIVLPSETSLLLGTQGKATAFAQLTTEYQFGAQEGEVIAGFLSKSIKNLNKEDIEVVDSDFNVLYSGGTELMSNGLSSQADAEAVMSDKIESGIKKLLRLRWPEVFVLTNLNFDWDKLNERSIQYSNPVGDEESNSGLIGSESTSQQSYQGGTLAGAPGLDTNDQAAATYNQGETTESSGSSKTAERDYLYNTVESVRDYEIGKFLKDNSSLSVAVYEYIYYNQADLEARGLLNNTTWAEFKAANDSYEMFEIDSSIIESLKTGTGISNISVLGFRGARFIDKLEQPIRIAEYITYGVVVLLMLFLAYMLLKRTQPDEVTEIEPTLTVEDMLISTKQEEEKIAEEERLREIEFGVESDVRKQINKFVADKPEAVAQLLRNWLSEDWS